MSGCPYYYWNYDYACRKTGKAVDSDIYYKYCRDYNYDECPMYKNEEQTGGCFLSSACIKAYNLSDDCEELRVLRYFRDTYLINRKNGREEIEEYYHIAPFIVQAIEGEENSREVWKQMYEELVCTCVDLIKVDENEEAYVVYSEFVKKLKNKYLS